MAAACLHGGGEKTTDTTTHLRPRCRTETEETQPLQKQEGGNLLVHPVHIFGGKTERIKHDVLCPVTCSDAHVLHCRKKKRKTTSM